MKNKTHALSDGEILKQSMSRPWMFSMLVDRYQKPFLRKSLHILKSYDSAEDVVADTFLKIYKNAQQFKEIPGVGFKSWAYKILMYTCYTELLNRKRNSVVGMYDFVDLDSMGFVMEEDKGEQSYVQSVLSRMPQKLSRFLKLYFFEEKSQKEIAEVEHMTETAVRSRIHRAKKSFKDVAKYMTGDMVYKTTWQT